MKINNLFRLAASALAFASLVACSKVPPGNEGVKVDTLGSRGVEPIPLPTGWYWVGFTYTIYNFPTFTQTYSWTKSPNEGSPNDESITFNTIDGMSVNADVGITYHIDPEKVTLVFQKYRQGIDEITNTFLHNMVRDALIREGAQYTIEDAYGAKRAELLDRAQKDVASEVGPIGIIIEHLSWIADLRPPQSVKDAINAKIAAVQKSQQSQNEVVTATAEAAKMVATAQGTATSNLTIARAEAEANKIVAASITPELVQWQIAKTWDGHLPQVTGGSTPFINIPTAK